jgi:hypothetical protein
MDRFSPESLDFPGDPTRFNFSLLLRCVQLMHLLFQGHHAAVQSQLLGTNKVDQ